MSSQSRRAYRPIYRLPIFSPPNSGPARRNGPYPVSTSPAPRSRSICRTCGREAPRNAYGAASRRCARPPLRTPLSSLFLDAAGTHVESVLCARGHFAQCHPEALRGVAIDVAALAQCAHRASAAVGISRYRLAAPRAGRGCRHAGGARHWLGTAGVVSHQGAAGGFSRPGLRLAARRLRRQSAAADEAARHQPRHRAGARAAGVGAGAHRRAQCAGRAGRQRRPVGLRRRGQRRLFLAALARDARLRRGRSQGRLRLAQPGASG